VGRVLVERSVMEQRFEAVMAVVRNGLPVTEVAAKFGVSRQSVHAWIGRYEAFRPPGASTVTRHC
jgi:transposase-like protein